MFLNDISKVFKFYCVEHSLVIILGLFVQVVVVQCQSTLYFWQTDSLNPGFSGGKTRMAV